MGPRHRVVSHSPLLGPTGMCVVLGVSTEWITGRGPRGPRGGAPASRFWGALFLLSPLPPRLGAPRGGKSFPPFSAPALPPGGPPLPFRGPGSLFPLSTRWGGRDPRPAKGPGWGDTLRLSSPKRGSAPESGFVSLPPKGGGNGEKTPKRPRAAPQNTRSKRPPGLKARSWAQNPPGGKSPGPKRRRVSPQITV